MRKLFIILLFCFVLAPQVQAAYVLPYPSFMPGNKIYKITRIVDELKAYWYWGPIAQKKYHMMLADKYLVEAKVLFEYGQYLLAADALERSNEHIVQASTDEQKAEHVRVLTGVKGMVPQDFTWTPEKSDATELSLHTMIDEAIKIRQ